MRENIQIDSSDFKHNGIKYFIDVRFAYKTDTDEREITLSMSGIKDIEINTQLNKLFSDGFIIYRDINGEIGRMIAIPNIICIITMTQNDIQSNGSIATEEINKDRGFQHSFIVDNIEIVDNDENSITYCINLTGQEYFKLLNHVSYSDYHLDEADKKTIIQLIGEMLTKYGKLKVDDSITKVTSGVKTKYISSGCDTVLTSIKYLLQKHFFITDNTEKSMKFITYDFIDDIYGFTEIGQTQSKAAYGTILSFNTTNMSEIMEQEQLKIGSISDLRRSDINQLISQLTIRNYDMASNTFNFKTYSSQQIINLLAGEKNRNVKLTNVEPNEDSFISRDVSEWDNDINVYDDMVNIFMRYDTVMLNIGGIIGRRLMNKFVISIDDRMDMINSDKTKKYEDYISRNKQLRGVWYITKIRYIIKPNENIFHQNLQLSRIGTNK